MAIKRKERQNDFIFKHYAKHCNLGLLALPRGHNANRLRSKLAKQAEKFNESTRKWQTLLDGANEDFEAVINDLKKSRNELYDLYQAALKENRERKIRHAAAQAKHRAKKRAEREAAQAAEAKSKRGGKK